MYRHGTLMGHILTVLILCAVMCATAVPAAAQGESGYTPRFEPADCAFDTPEGYEIECGYLVVPEDRSQPDGAWIRLHVAIFKSRSETPLPDPVIYLAGGGGYNQLDAVGHYLGDARGDAILAERDYIHYNQRGADYGDPVVDCPAHVETLQAMAREALTQEERNAREQAALLACRDTLTAEGIDLTQYNSATNAADANDLRIALGYEQANYYGTSYGTKLALTLMRDYPDGVRSVILDSVYPPQVDYYSDYAPNVVRSFEHVFAACAADASCSARYPNIDQTFYAAIDRLNAAPVTRTIGEYTVVVNGNMLLEAMELMLYDPGSIAALPWMIDNASHDRFEPMDGLFYALLTDIPSSINWTMFYAMQCREEIPFEDRAQVAARAAGAPPELADFYRVRWAEFAFDLCAQWEMPAADPVENEPVESDIPALVLAGAYDPATPPAWSQSAAEHLSHSFYVEFPAMSHGVMRNGGCGLSIGMQFLADPTTPPDTSCIETMHMPAFN
ncbi:MAG TPA: alpha/beta fold hydrolase [Aggregatilinea sp.]|uniref:alpha/beta fold hydrolase n=1 Tax=Aggregatilinea sp. TaxID=2806333 RepID=UPI002B9CF8A5|nr:alpha/beta fold hydrolase [Aggregatilinea sp.]HML22597.1 alpha/beta fold hydrolase [Aggregatilinea sp.]